MYYTNIWYTILICNRLLVKQNRQRLKNEQIPLCTLIKFRIMKKNVNNSYNKRFILYGRVT